MGMFDTIYFDKLYACSKCGAGIASTQTKAFERTLSDYHVKDCISHAEDIRIVKEELHCIECSAFTGQYVYLAVVRGILVGIAETLEAAQRMLSDLNLEKMILWYHDMFSKYEAETRNVLSSYGFMQQVVEWFEKGYDKKQKEGGVSEEKSIFIQNREYLRNAAGPLEAIKKYLAEREKKGVISA